MQIFEDRTNVWSDLGIQAETSRTAVANTAPMSQYFFLYVCINYSNWYVLNFNDLNVQWDASVIVFIIRIFSPPSCPTTVPFSLRTTEP